MKRTLEVCRDIGLEEVLRENTGSLPARGHGGSTRRKKVDRGRCWTFGERSEEETAKAREMTDNI